MKSTTGPQQLYRYFDADGRLLYVGVSGNAFARLTQHRGKAPWWESIASMTVEWHQDRRSVLRAERQAIKDEEPIWNKQHAKPVSCGHCSACRGGEPEECPLSWGDNECECGEPGCPYMIGYEIGSIDEYMRWTTGWTA